MRVSTPRRRMMPQRTAARRTWFGALVILCAAVPFIARSQSDPELEDLLNQDIVESGNASTQFERTATRDPVPVTDTPASVTVITSEDIERYGYRTLDEALWTVPGFYLNDLRSIVFVGSRGFSRSLDFNNRLLLLLNGTTLNDPLVGAGLVDNLFGLSIDLVDRIEVAQGPGSAVYGTNAMFGTINVVTKQGADIDGLRLSAEAGSFGRESGSFTYGWNRRGETDVLVSGRRVEIAGAYDDWENVNEGYVQLRHGDFSLFGKYGSNRAGIVTSDLETTHDDPGIESINESSVVEGRYEHGFGLNRHMMLRGFFTTGTSKSTSPAQTGGRSRTKTDVGRIGAESRFLWDVSPSNRLIFGAEVLRSYRVRWSQETLGVSTLFAGDFPVSVVSAYIQDEYQIHPNLSLTAGLRADSHSTDVSDINPRFAAIYHPTGATTLKLLYSEAFRAPTTLEREYELEGVFVRNNNLQPEEIRTYEVVWLQNIGDYVTTNVSAYRYAMDNLIELVFDLEALKGQYVNTLRVEATGADIGARARLASGAQAYVQYSRQNAKDSMTDLRLTNSPENLLKVGASVPALERFTLSAEGLYESSRLTLERNDTEPFFLLNASVSVKLPVGVFGLAKLTVKNLLDNDYTIPSGFEIPIPQEGRDVTLRVSLGF